MSRLLRVALTLARKPYQNRLVLFIQEILKLSLNLCNVYAYIPVIFSMLVYKALLCEEVYRYPTCGHSADFMLNTASGYGQLSKTFVVGSVFILSTVFQQEQSPNLTLGNSTSSTAALSCRSLGTNSPIVLPSRSSVVGSFFLAGSSSARSSPHSARRVSSLRKVVGYS